MIDGFARQWIETAIDQQSRLGGQDGTQAIERLTDAINDSFQQTHADRDTMFIADGCNFGPRDDTLELFAGHQKQFVTRKADDFGLQVTVQRVNSTEGADRRSATDGLQSQSDDASQFPSHARSRRHIGNPIALQPLQQTHGLDPRLLRKKLRSRLSMRSSSIQSMLEVRLASCRSPRCNAGSACRVQPRR